MAKNYFRGGNGFILVYDITDKKSFDKLKGWINDAKEKIVGSYKMIIAGNKKDCKNQRKVDYDILQEFGKKNNVKYMEVVTLGVGSLFGEMALNDTNALRKATIITTSDCHFSVLNKKTFNILFMDKTNSL